MTDDRSDVGRLVADAERGDERAWGEIVDRYTPLVVTVGLRCRVAPSELPDLAQTVWLRLVEHLGDLREPRALPRWLITTARREALRAATASWHLQPTDPHDAAWDLRLAVEDDADAGLVRAERHAALHAWFDALSARQQQLLTILAESPPVTYAEISRRTGMPVGAIGPTRARALARLRGAHDPGSERVRSTLTPVAREG